MRDKKKVLLCAKSAITHGSGLSLSFFFLEAHNGNNGFLILPSMPTPLQPSCSTDWPDVPSSPPWLRPLLL